MEQGIIDLEAYLSRQSYNRIKAHFYVYEKLHTYNFDSFKDLQLNPEYGKRSHLENVSLLIDQGLINTFDVKELNEVEVTNKESYERTREIVKYLSIVHKEHWITSDRFDKSNELSEKIEYSQTLIDTRRDIISLRERLYGLLYSEKNKITLHPTTSLDCYGALDLKVNKSDVLRLIIDKFPIPDQNVPLCDIIQYREEESNKLRFLRLRSWIRKVANENLTISELEEEITLLMMEYENEMKLAGLKIKNARIEFAIKIIPQFFENILRLKFSELADPWLKLRSEKISLLQTENNSKGNELSYVIRALN